MSNMGGAMTKISEQSLPQIRHGFGMRNAWAAYVRERWPTNTQAMVEREWTLTPGRANGVVWANITQNTIDMILDHPRGGLLVMLAVLAKKWRTDLAGLLMSAIDQQRRKLADARIEYETQDERLAALAPRAAALRPLHDLRRSFVPGSADRDQGERRRASAGRPNRPSDD